jgi:para-aminobenzoate synthetase component 1
MAHAARATRRRRPTFGGAAWTKSAAAAGDTEDASQATHFPANLRLASSLPREAFLKAVVQAQRYINAGDIYQVNLAQRLSVGAAPAAWDWFTRLGMVSPAPFAALVNAGDTQVVSSSPELFLRLSGGQVVTRPIKGTRPRGAGPDADARLAYELRTSPKENAELVMITDLLRNDLGRICQFGSVTVSDLARLERFAQVQHLVSTVEGRLRPEVTHLEALRACFPWRQHHGGAEDPGDGDY